MARAFIRRRYRKDPDTGKRRLTGFEVEWRNDTGGRRRKLHKTHAEAAAHRDQLNAPRSADKSGQSVGTITLEQAGRNWIQRVKGDGRARATWRKYEQRIERHIVPLMVAPADGQEPRRFGDYTLGEVTTPLCVRYKAALQKAGRSPAMVQKVMADLRMLLSSAQLAGEVDRNAAAPVKAKRGERHKEPVEIPTPEQVRAILNAMNANDDELSIGRVWLNVLPMTGLRPEETRGLGWNYVLFGASPPVIRVAMAADEQGLIGSPKSKAGYRDIPMPPSLAALLKRWKLKCPKSNGHEDKGGLVFPTSAGHVFNWSNFHARIWRPLMKALHTDELPFIRVLPAIDEKTGEPLWETLFSPYALRHWFASYLIKVRGKNPKQVQRLMGHERIELTFQIYGHLWSDPKDDAAVAEGLDAFLKAANDSGT